MNVIVYGKPECVMCEHTKKQLEKAGVEYEYRDVATNDVYRASAGAAIREHDLLEHYPVVVVSNHHRTVAWSGFKIDMIKGLRETGDY